MNRILFVYGYGSSAKSPTAANLQEYLSNDKFEVICKDYSQYDPVKALEDIKGFIKEYNINLVIGSSLGGFLTLNLREIPKLVINPCVHPETELEKLTPAVPQEIVDAYKNFIKEHDIWDGYDFEEKMCTMSLVSIEDELFGTKFEPELQKHIKWVFEIHQGHRSTKEDINRNLGPYVLKWFNEIYPQVISYFGCGVHM